MARPEPVIFMVAGERSGDLLAAGLIRELKKYYPLARFEGVAGPAMRDEGCYALADIEALSLFGIGEVIAHIPRLLRLRRRLFEHCRLARPAVFIGIDAPAFNTGLERRIKALGIPTVQYVCPTAWAWRQSRTRAIREAVDVLLAIFPFEPAFFADFDIRARFVGHPLADRAPLIPAREGARAMLSLAGQGPVVGLLPGSRQSEVSRLGPPMLDTAAWLVERIPDVRFIVPLASPSVREVFERMCQQQNDNLPIQLIDGRSQEVMRAADVVLMASGTATLEALLCKTPMVVAYRLSVFNYWLVRGFRLVKTRHVSMPNLLANDALVPELLQDDASPQQMGPAVRRLLESGHAREAQTSRFGAIHRQLAIGADCQAARAIADLLVRQP